MDIINHDVLKELIRQVVKEELAAQAKPKQEPSPDTKPLIAPTPVTDTFTPEPAPATPAPHPTQPTPTTNPTPTTPSANPPAGPTVSPQNQGGPQAAPANLPDMPIG